MVLCHLLERVEALEVDNEQTILHLIERVEVLEADATSEGASMATDEELFAAYSDTNNGDFIDPSLRAVYNLNHQHGAAQPPAAQPAPPALETDDGDVAIDRWIEGRPDWPNSWPAVTQCQLAALIGEALEHWGRPAAVPVAVSERLPDSRPESEGGDCDAEGKCWWFSPPACGPHKIRRRSCWTLDSETMEGDTHWRPASAIPLPQAGEVEA
jgi:hypothetical protein